MDIKKKITELRRLKGAITVDNAMELLVPGKTIFVFLQTDKSLILLEGDVTFIQYHDSDGRTDIRVLCRFQSDQKPKHTSIIIGASFNGWSDLAGDEDMEVGFNRVFLSRDAAVSYFEDIQFVGDQRTLERTRGVQSYITRLLSNGKKKDPE